LFSVKSLHTAKNKRLCLAAIGKVAEVAEGGGHLPPAVYQLFVHVLDEMLLSRSATLSHVTYSQSRQQTKT
jgi:hypothetical protein